jgi:hypothetical protein
MKYCSSCGKQWAKGAKFCAHCGFKRPNDEVLSEDENLNGLKEQRYASQVHTSQYMQKEVIQSPTDDSDRNNESEKRTNWIKRKRLLLISTIGILIVSVSSFLFIFNNNEPKLSAEEMAAIERNKELIGAMEYIEENGYEEDESSDVVSNPETALVPEESVEDESVNAAEKENSEADSIIEDSEDASGTTIEGNWHYQEMNQVYEISFIDDFNGMLRITPQSMEIGLSFKVTNFIDDNLEIVLASGEKWTLKRDGDDLNIWKDDGTNLILKSEHKTN